MQSGSRFASRIILVALVTGAPVAALLWLLGDDAARAMLAGGVGAALAGAAAALLIAAPAMRLGQDMQALQARPLVGVPRPPGGVAAPVWVALREAEWRSAHAGAVSVGAARLSHDLRGILSPAMLAVERVQMQTEPSLRRSGEVAMRALERATETLRHGFDFLREGLPPHNRTRFSLRDALALAVGHAQALCPRLDITLNVDRALQVNAEQAAVVVALAELLRNAGEAGANAVVVTATPHGSNLDVVLTDDGPGLPGPVQAAAFLPVGEPRGHGMAIARDLLRSQGGQVAVKQTGPSGTSLGITLPAAR